MVPCQVEQNAERVMNNGHVMINGQVSVLGKMAPSACTSPICVPALTDH